MNNQTGIASLLIILLAVIVLLLGLYFMFGLNLYNLLNIKTNPLSTTTSSSEVSNQDFRGTKKDINDPRFDLVKQKYNLTKEQLEILSTVAEGDR